MRGAKERFEKHVLGLPRNNFALRLSPKKVKIVETLCTDYSILPSFFWDDAVERGEGDCISLFMAHYSSTTLMAIFMPFMQPKIHQPARREDTYYAVKERPFAYMTRRKKGYLAKKVEQLSYKSRTLILSSLFFRARSSVTFHCFIS